MDTSYPSPSVTATDADTSSAGDDYGTDYSSDASISRLSIQSNQHQNDSVSRQTNSRRRRRMRQPSNHASTSSHQVPVFPVIYKFTDATTGRLPGNEGNGGLMRGDSEKVGISNLKELVKYSPCDLCSRAWYLLSPKTKVCGYPPYARLPPVPNIFEVNFTDTSEVSGFICNAAANLIDRTRSPTTTLFCSLLVGAAIHEEIRTMKQTATMFHSIETLDIDPQWETDTDDEEIDFNLSADCADVYVTDINVALALPSFQEKVPMHTLRLLHLLLNKCLRTYNIDVLGSWSVRHVTQVLLKQIDEEATKVNTNEKWLAACVSLIYKMVFTSGNIDMLLTLLRWTYRHVPKISSISVDGIAPLVSMLESFNVTRIRVPLPPSDPKGQLISFPHSLSNSPPRVKGMCVVHEEGEQACILLTESGVLKISLKPPFNVIQRNEFYVPDVCQGVFVEGNKIAVVGDSGKSVDILDASTLEKEDVVSPPDTLSERFCYYSGQGSFVSPFFPCGEPPERYAYFYGTEVSGSVEPASVLLPRTCDSMSVQFFLCPVATLVPTSMIMVSLSFGEKVWLLVKVFLDPTTSTQRIVLEHGGDVVAETQEAISPVWTLWSATLSCINDGASWAIFKNGSYRDTISKAGPLVRPAAPLTVKILSGTFSGYMGGLQVWSRAQTIGDMKMSATEGRNPNRSQFLLCSFRMDEGVGCCLHSPQTGMIWRGTSLSWGNAPNTLAQKPRPEEKIYWRPSGNYYIVTNDCETAIIDDYSSTWVDTEGRIVEQHETKLLPRDKHFYCTKTSRLYFVAQENLGIRWVPTSHLPSSCVRGLSSMQRGKALCAEVAQQPIGEQLCSAANFARYMASKLNTVLLTGEGIVVGRKKFLSTDQLTTVSLRTIGRLLTMCTELISNVEADNMSEYDELLLCIAGRLLIKQVTQMDRQCPERVVLSIVEFNSSLQKASNTNWSFGDEVSQVFTDLHQVVLSECVSHDYQLKLITESKSLRDVKQLLVPQNVPPLVDCVIRKDMKKPFMTFLNRMKEECQNEADAIFSGSKGEMDISSAMLATVLSMLAQKERAQWHLVAVALVSSLCKGVLRLYEKCFPSEKERSENTQLLQQTCVGSVLFPTVHFLHEMEFDNSVVGDVLKVLKDIRGCLRPYRTGDARASKSSVKFGETYSVVLSPQQVPSFTATINLQHARAIRVEVHVASEETEWEVPLLVSFVDNDLVRTTTNLGKEELSINRGGRLSISCNGECDMTGVSLVVQADVDFIAETTNWVNDVCLALGKTIIRTSYRSLLVPMGSPRDISRDSFLRGGLSREVLRGEKIECGDENEALCDERSTLLTFAENEEDEVQKFWLDSFTTVRLPFVDRLGAVVRWASCALVWHTRRVDSSSDLETDIRKAIEWFKLKAIFLLERIQQGKREELINRARFLLIGVTPRYYVETQLLELQHTEEPVGGAEVSHDRVSKLRSRGARSVDQRSRFGVSRQRPGADLSSVSRWGASGSVRRTAAAAVHIFANNMKDQSESVQSQLLRFLTSSSEDVDTISLDFVERTNRAITHISAYKLQEELCRSRAEDREILNNILDAHLQYRRHLARCAHKANADSGDHGATGGGGGGNNGQFDFNRHYAEHLRGCGMMRELELQRAGCSFLLTALREVTKDLSTSSKSLPRVEAIGMCALLCHPWDSLDMTILQPSDIFGFLQKLLSRSFGARLRGLSGRDLSTAYLDSKGLLDLCHRCLVTPNSLFLTAVDGVHIVDGEVQGLHVENVSIVCSARNHWKPLARGPQHRSKRTRSDLYANYGLPCVVTKTPDVQYFEITLDLSVHDNPKVAMGVSSVPLAPTEPVRSDDAVVFALDGHVRFKNSGPVRFCDPWNVGDVIGCGVMAPSNSVFFTRNGEFLGVATQSNFSTFIPFVEVQGVNSLLKVIVNFGEETPFAFDISSLHCSCRHTYISNTTVCDAALITADYLVSICYNNLAQAHDDVLVNQDAISVLLEHAAGFLSASVKEFLTIMNNLMTGELDTNDEEDGSTHTLEPLVTVISRLLHCVDVVIECFRFDAVTPRTHAVILQLCTVTLESAKEKSIKCRAAQCLGMLREVMRPDYLIEATASLKHMSSAENVVGHLVELARVKLLREPDNILPPPKWMGSTTVVRGNGTFFGSAPMPRRGTHMIGFRITRRNHQGQGIGTPLGGCYYLGLCHGQPQISGMDALLKRNDVYVLQDTDDKDQVPHLLLRRHCIPSNSHRRIYGNSEVVWVELNADAREITFYRENMVLIGLAFTNIQRIDDLYPIVFLFNEDAWCEIVAPASLKNESAEEWAENLRRSIAINALQQLHMVPYFSSAVSQMAFRAITHLDKNLESCLVALALLGGERSYLYCQHDSFGLVIVDSIAEISERAVIYVANDEQKHLFSVSPGTLRPSFVQTPLYASDSVQADECAILLTEELRRNLYEASLVTPLVERERKKRALIEDAYSQSVQNVSSLDLVAILSQLQPKSPSTPSSRSPPEAAEVQQSRSDMIRHIAPTIIERQHSTSSLFTPNPSIGVTTSKECSIMRGNPVFSDSFVIAVSIPQSRGDELMYVGLTASTSTFPQRLDEVANWEDSWALCSCDSAKTNSINCCVEPGMLFGGEATLYAPRDVLIMSVSRTEGSVSYSRVRKRKVIEFGVLFDSVPPECVVRPFVACGADTVAIFSFADGVTFPARNAYPISHFTAPCRDTVRHCSVCDRHLAAPWYGGEDSVALCDSCFKCWQYPKDLFYIECAPVTAPEIPAYLVSRCSPEVLRVGSYVEFEESAVPAWSSPKSVNAEANGTSSISILDECFMVTEPLPMHGSVRVDVKLSHVAGAEGNSFSGLFSFTPLWREGQQTSTSCVLPKESLFISSSIVSQGSKAVFSVKISDPSTRRSVTPSGIFVGATNFSDTAYTVTSSDLERRSSTNNIWGTWCDTKDKLSPDGTLFVLMDAIQGLIMVSASLGGLYYSPFVITCNIGAEDDHNLRFLLFSREACHVTSVEGVASYPETTEPSLAPIAIGLVPESFNNPNEDNFMEAVVLMDTLQRTESFSRTSWTYTQHARNSTSGTLFHIGDTITVMQRSRDVLMFCQGIQVAAVTLSEEKARRRHRLLLYCSVGGITATFVPPLYGRTHLGRVVRVYGPEVCVVECASDSWEKEYYAVRRRDIRFCALGASTFPTNTVKEGLRVAFKISGMQLPKRGTVVAVTGGSVTVTDSEGDRIRTPLKLEHCFILDNEGKTITRQVLYPLVTPPTNTIARVFEVGKTKYRIQSKGSYNGIMFDCRSNDTIELISLSILSQTTGRHRAEVFFRRGSHMHHEHDPTSWTQVYSGFVDMCIEQQFTISFSAIHVEAGSTFSLYINTSHNCGVGFFCEDSGCDGNIGDEFDNDSTVTVYLGRKSGSSTAFCECSTYPRGFCGTMIYKQSKGSKPPLIEEGKEVTSVQKVAPMTLRGGVITLVSRPLNIRKASSIRFFVQVLNSPIIVECVRIPVMLQPFSDHARGLSHCLLSMFYASASEVGKSRGHPPDDDKALDWVWAWNSRVLLEGESTLVRVTGSDIRLEKGSYVFTISVQNSMDNPDGNHALLLATDDTYSRQNSFIAVRGLYGDVLVEDDAPVVSGEQHTMATGTYLNQNSSASYNGIMFDLRSKDDITLEEIYCLSQTTQKHVAVRVFWKKESLDGAENSPSQWTEVSTLDIHLVDKQPFSIGDLFLRMEANQTYAVYINTSSNCGICFYSSSDGQMGEVGDEFENDGTLSVHVGLKSESSTPFSVIPKDARAFKGKLVYRSCSSSIVKSLNQALFSCSRAYVVTRILVALTSYVDTCSRATRSKFSYDRLLVLVSAFATSSSASTTDLNGAENLLSALLKKALPEELKSGTVVVPLAQSTRGGFCEFGKDDAALLTNAAAPSKSVLVFLSSAPSEDGTVLVRNNWPDPVSYHVATQRLIPVTRCWQCHSVWAPDDSSSSSCCHKPPASEEIRIASLVAKGVIDEFGARPQAAWVMAEALLANPSLNISSKLTQLTRSENNTAAGPSLFRVVAVSDNRATFSMPLRQVLSDVVDVERQAFVCPFVHSAALQANISLYIRPHNTGIDVSLVTDGTLEEDSILSSGPNPESGLKVRGCFGLTLLAATSDDSHVPLMEAPLHYFAGARTEVTRLLVANLQPSKLVCMRTDESIVFTLQIEKTPFPPESLPISLAGRRHWTWEDGTAEALLNAQIPMFLKDSFTEGSWPLGKSHFCSFMATSKGKEKTVFLEIHVVSTTQRPVSLWQGAKPKTSSRKPFTVASGELVTLGISPEGEFFIFDTEDVVRFRISSEELGMGSKGACHRIGFLSVDQNEVTALLAVPSDVGRSLSPYTPKLPSSRNGEGYDPLWVTYDPARVKVSKNHLTASCCSEVSGQVVLGLAMPSSGVSAFIMQVGRRDCSQGAPLGSGHFAGVSVCNFAQRAPHFRDLKSSVHPLWVVQDVQDGDSLPTQEQLPPLEREEKGRELFCCGTKLLFIVDRCAGTVSLARDNESPRIIFHDLPTDVDLCPFVRLDHTTSFATLSRFSHSRIYSLHYHPSLERTVASQPLTPSLLRRFPFLVVLKLFPLLYHVVSALPPHRAAAMERCWSEPIVRQRYEYRVSKAMEALVEAGGFSKRMLHCDDETCRRVFEGDELQRVTAFLAATPSAEVAVFPGGSTSIPNVYFQLPDTYELVGRVRDSDMMRVIYVGPEGGPIERTLQLVRLENPTHNVQTAMGLLPHPFCIRQNAVLQPLNNVPACGILFTGWFDCTLDTFPGTLTLRDEKKVATAVVCALEHWHLHGIPHCHVTPENILLRVIDGAVVTCSFWNVRHLRRTSPFAAPNLFTRGVRGFKEDRWSCAKVLRTLQLVCTAEPSIADFAQMLEQRDASIFELLHEVDAFRETPESGEEGPSYTLKTGTRFREGTGSGSYNGIMFDVIAKSTTVRITNILFVPDTNCVATVSLYTRKGSFMGFESKPAAWTRVLEAEMVLSANVDTLLSGFPPITIPVGSRSGVFLHTTSGSGVLFYSEAEGVSAGMGRIEEENNDIGITVGKKCESNQPFMAVQNQMRLLKGSITYTLIMRSNGPRSGLIYTYEGGSECSTATELETPVEPVVVDGRGRGLLICTRSHKSMSLVLLTPGVYEWVPSSTVFESTYKENDSEMSKLERIVEQERLRSTNRMLRSSYDWRGFERNIRPLVFTSALPDNSCHSHPVLCSGEPLWVSEALPPMCTLSLWQVRPSQVCACVVRIKGSPTYSAARGMNASLLHSGSDILRHKRRAFAWVEAERGCVYLSASNSVIQIISESDEAAGDCSTRLVLWLPTTDGEAGNASLRNEVFAFTSIQPRNIDERIGRNMSLLYCSNRGSGACTRGEVGGERDGSTVSSVVVDDVAVQTNATPAVSGDGWDVHLRLQSVRGIGNEVEIVGLCKGDSTAQQPAHRAMVKSNEVVERRVTCASPAALVKATRLHKLRSVQQFTMQAQSTSLEVHHRTVTQVLYSSSTKCSVTIPRFIPAEVHEVTLRVAYPTHKPPHIYLEHPSTSVSSIELPYSVPYELADLWTSPHGGVQEVLVKVYVDLQHSKVLVFSSTGAFSNLLLGKTCSTDLQLAFTFHAPGSTVEVLEWRRSEPRSSISVTSKQLHTIARGVNERGVSANVSQTVGAVTRHSARYSAPHLRDQGITASKQMEVLTVNYARLLLERSLVAQDAARRAAQGELHYLLSFTSMRSSPLVQSIIDGELRQNSLNLFAQSCAYLSLPLLAQSTACVDTSINVIASGMMNETIMEFMASVAGPSLILLLLRVATIFSRSTRHVALQCVQKLLANNNVPLPSHDALSRHLEPLLRMMNSLCKRQNMSSAVVQIGVTLVADLVQRYKYSRPTLQAPGTLTDVPFHIIVCARAMIDAITNDPPRALPAAMLAEKPSLHRISCVLVEKPTTIRDMTAVSAVFTEVDRNETGTKSFDVVISGHRKGVVVVGWNVDVATSQGSQQPSQCTADGIPLPFCGYYIEAISGKVTVCVGQKKGDSPLRVGVKTEDIITVTCSYREKRVCVQLRRGSVTELSTNFALTEVSPIGLPFFFAQHKADATLVPDKLASGASVVDVAEMYARYQKTPGELDTVQSRSFDFYAELNLFVQSVLSKEEAERLAGSSKDTDDVTVLSHEIVSYTHIVSFVGAAAYEERISLLPLRPYIQRLSLFDSITVAFSPLINLQRKSELFDIFRVLKNLCSHETEERIQSNTMRPFLRRQGRKAHVTIHTMQAQPSASLGAFPTLMRSVFGQLYLQLHRTTTDTFYDSPIFTVKLAGFGSADAGGPYRDVLSQLASEIMTPHPSGQFQINPLFIQCGKGSASAIMPNPTLLSSSQAPLMLEFFGKLLASFFITIDVLAVELPPMFWRQLIGEQIGTRDLTSLDPDIMALLSPDALMERTADELAERFPGIDELWAGIIEDSPNLIIDRTLPPTSIEAAQILVDRVASNELNRFAEAIACIQQGFDQVLPLSTLQAFRWQTVELKVCGAQKLSFEAFRDECDIQLSEEDSKMFLKVLQLMSDEDRTLLLRFTTGQSRLPLKSRIKVLHSGTTDSLPTSSTCFFTLRIPAYTSIEKMKERILYASRQCKAIDADGQARETLILDI